MIDKKQMRQHKTAFIESYARHKKGTLTPDDVIGALTTLNFSNPAIPRRLSTNPSFWDLTDEMFKYLVKGTWSMPPGNWDHYLEGGHEKVLTAAEVNGKLRVFDSRYLASLVELDLPRTSEGAQRKPVNDVSIKALFVRHDHGIDHLMELLAVLYRYLK